MNDTFLEVYYVIKVDVLKSCHVKQCYLFN